MINDQYVAREMGTKGVSAVKREVNLIDGKEETQGGEK